MAAVGKPTYSFGDIWDGFGAVTLPWSCQKECMGHGVVPLRDSHSPNGGASSSVGRCFRIDRTPLASAGLQKARPQAGGRGHLGLFRGAVLINGGTGGGVLGGGWAGGKTQSRAFGRLTGTVG